MPELLNSATSGALSAGGAHSHTTLLHPLRERGEDGAVAVLKVRARAYMYLYDRIATFSMPFVVLPEDSDGSSRKFSVAIKARAGRSGIA